MPRLAANLSLLFADRPLPERFAAARRAGFDEVEIQFPYSHSIPELATACQAAGVRVVLINLPAGDRAGLAQADLSTIIRLYQQE